MCPRYSQQTSRQRLANWLVNCVVGIFTFSLILGSPWLLKNAAAHTRTANPAPQFDVPHWQGDPQTFADATRVSVTEVRDILASYSQSRAPTPMLPRLAVQDAPLCRLVMDGQISYCQSGDVLYINRQAVLTLAEQSIGAVAAFLAEQLLNSQANFDPKRAACMVGAWLGYMQYWGMINPHLANQAITYMQGRYPQPFNTGRQARSLDPCATH